MFWSGELHQARLKQLTVERITSMTPAKAIKTYFEQDGGRRVDLAEMKSLSREERNELGKLACEALGETFEETNYGS